MATKGLTEHIGVVADGGEAPRVRPASVRSTLHPGRPDSSARARSRTERRASPGPAPGATPTDPCDFLVGHLIDHATLERARAIARRWRWPIPRTMIALGWLEEHAYVAALARHLAVPVAAPGDGAMPIDAIALSPTAVARAVRDHTANGRPVALSSRRRRGPASRPPRPGRLGDGLPAELSAATGAWAWQWAAGLTLVAGLTCAASLAPLETLSAVSAALALPFVFVVILKGLALMEVLAPAETSAPEGPNERTLDADLPLYAVLVPLYREAAVVPDIVSALAALDYPPSRLDVVFLLEADDTATRAAFAHQSLPAHMRIQNVPPGLPRTKPRALCHGLEASDADIVVVYDAEDLPEPGQLRAAVTAISAAPERIGCVQARLNIHNAGRSWLTRQFAIEYTALFDATLPMLVRLGLPVPLGGTSNHFPRAVLDVVGGWDPYNVTEDADLGIRLARSGWAVAMIPSTTWEEAPETFGTWLRQRTRWLKGWMQTLLVHTRRPDRLLADLGDLRCLGFLALMGGLVLSALVHPWVFVIAILEWQLGIFLDLPVTLLGQSMWGLALVNLGLGYIVAMVLGAAAAMRRGRPWLVLHVVLMPIYWLAVSLAAHRALLQMLSDPFRWEKTPHAPRAPSTGVDPPG